MTPQESYQQDLLREDFSPDPAQLEAIRHAQRLFDDLLASTPRASGSGRSPWAFRRGSAGGKIKPLKGIYFWGSVGRGKTYVMDTLFECLPFSDKLRAHFHSFMLGIHRELKGLDHVRNPLDSVAKRLAASTRVLCLDELHVGDITDAMLLGNFFRAAFERGITLVATSNEAPESLYWDGLQRERFLPAIALIQAHTDVVHVAGDVDYRLRRLERARIYHCPLDSAADSSLRSSFVRLARGEGATNAAVEVEGRPIQAVRRADGVVWFDFDQICGGPRAPSDYIEIALCYQTVLIANIPCMNDKDNDKAKRFSTLVDTFYDRNVKLIVSADAMPASLYRGRSLQRVFQRTISRLEEMQTHAYLSKEHLP
ncbi:MAG: cell division protein ZapE [Gammaproteobacteria bacterium]